MVGKKKLNRRNEKITEKEAHAILKKYCNEHGGTGKDYQNILQHGVAVKKTALVIAKAIQKKGHKVDLDLIKTGSILHDIGYFKAHWKGPDSIRHGVEGSKMLRKEGLLKHAKIAENHIGPGLTKEDIIVQKFKLPKRDFLPMTIEEKIICYVDKLVFHDRLGTLQEVVDKFERKKLPPAATKRLIQLHNEIEKLRGGVQEF
tara:strand:- start:229 stop:834 length:606 start_codon:yes stop_codon:yes gene_type:complete